MLKKFTLNLNNQTGTIEAVQFTVDTSAPRHPAFIVVPEHVKIEITDQATLTGPQNLILKRTGSDLFVTFVDEKVDLVLVGFYNHPENGIVGLAENGNFYHYLPETGANSDYMTNLQPGQAVWNTLGGDVTTALYSEKENTAILFPPPPTAESPLAGFSNLTSHVAPNLIHTPDLPGSLAHPDFLAAFENMALGPTTALHAPYLPATPLADHLWLHTLPFITG